MKPHPDPRICQSAPPLARLPEVALLTDALRHHLRSPASRVASLAVALLALSALPTTRLAAYPATTEYPVVTIAAKNTNPDLPPPGGQVPLTNKITTLNSLEMIYGNYVNPMPALKALQPGLTTPLLPYMGGYTTDLAPDSTLAQSSTYRGGVAMTQVATLPTGGLPDENAGVTRTFTLAPLAGIPMAILPATSQAGESFATIDFDDPDHFDFWIRIGTELMQVTAFNLTSKSITVKRGYAGGSAPTPHNAGARVFAPVYVGGGDDIRFANGYPAPNVHGPNPDTPVRTIHYALDPGSYQAENLKAFIVDDFMDAEGFDGSWWDTFTPVYSNMCDALGNPVRIITMTGGVKGPGRFWNFAAGQLYDDISFAQELKSYAQNVRTKLQTTHGHNGNAGNPKPIMYANTNTNTYRINSLPDAGTEVLANSVTPAVSNRLDGICFEDSFLVYDDVTEVFDKVLEINAAWTGRLNRMVDAANDGRAVICMAGPAGNLANLLYKEYEGAAAYNDKMRYSYASFLMCVTPTSKISFGLPLIIVEGNPDKMVPLPAIIFAPIGNPTQTSNPHSLASRKLANGAYTRTFQNGFVAVYPVSGTGSVSITVPTPPSGKAWHHADLAQGAPGAAVGAGSFTLAKGKGIVLVAE